MKSELNLADDSQTVSPSESDEAYELQMILTLNEMASKILAQAEKKACDAAELHHEADEMRTMAISLMDRAIFHASTLARLKDQRQGQVDW